METKQKQKVVAYVRISSLRQVDNESTVTQRDIIQKYADQNNFEIVAWFEDIAKSGKNADRDGLLELMKYCFKHKGEIKHWLVYNMKRASRDIDTYSSNVKLVLRAKGVTIRSATEPAVNDTKEGRMLETILVALGQLDNEGKAEVTIDNMRALAMQGYWQHPPIVGYDVHKIPNELGKLRPSLKPNTMADKVKQVLERYSQANISKAELTRYASKIGLRSRYGKVPSEDRINRLLKHPAYAGYISDKFTGYELVEGKHLALISQDTFERNQSLLNGKSSRKNETHLKVNRDYPLKGVLLCENCEKKMYASAPTTGSGSKSPRYHCSRPSCRGVVSSVKARKVHDDFEQMLRKLKPTEGVVKLYKTILIREANNSLGRLNTEISDLRQEVSDIDNTRVNAIQKLTEGLITPEEKSQLTERLDMQKLKKTSRLEKLESQQTIRETDIELAINQMEEVDAQWATSDIDIQIRFQSMLFPRGVVYDSDTGKFGTKEISPLYRYVPTKKDLSEPEKSFLVAGAGLEPATLWL